MNLDQLCAAWAPRLLSVLRIFVGLLYLEFGLAKHFGFPHAAMFDNLQHLSLIGVAGLIELIGGAALVIGLFTRPVAFIMSGEMAFAYFIEHAPRSFFPLLNGGTLAVLACFLFLYIAAAGPGPWSIDALRRGR